MKFFYINNYQDPDVVAQRVMQRNSAIDGTRKVELLSRLLQSHGHEVTIISSGIRRNIWKDSQTMRAAIALVAERCTGQKILFIAVGENAPPEQIGKAEILFVPYQKDSKVVAAYYQVADIYLHAAKADTFPTTILKALACGTPVVATSVGVSLSKYDRCIVLQSKIQETGQDGQ